MLSKNSIAERLTNDGWILLSGEQDFYRSPNKESCIRLHFINKESGDIEFFLQNNPESTTLFPLTEKGLEEVLTLVQQLAECKDQAMSKEIDKAGSQTAPAKNDIKLRQ